MHSTISSGNKSSYVYLSLILGLVFLAVDIADYVTVTVYRDPYALPSSWRFTLVLAHVFSFYCFLIGFIYSYEANKIDVVKVAFVSFAVNLAAFVVRVDYEVRFEDYH